MNSSPSAMVDVESSLSAAAEEEMARFPVATKPASDKMVAKVDSEEEDCGFSMMVAEDSSEEEVRPDRFVDSQVRDAWNARYARYFGRFEDTAKIPKKPRRKLPAEEEREHFQVETKPSDKMRGFAKMVAKVDSEGESGFDKMVAKVDSEEESGFGKMVAEDSSEELGPDHIFEAQASCFKETWEGLYSPYFGRFEDTSELSTLRSTPWKGPVFDFLPCLLYPGTVSAR
ncbi:hypothetical protein EJB05_16815 [Eragrostis curvula]|uniref:Uncharacterized protein n=1 Tax=Eragrostis curvula TaxID=38414 RepID=A0A5J9VH88_9POAL|nr:hypothetical protein EJB05_16815 [Eragrostis curvula]